MLEALLGSAKLFEPFIEPGQVQWTVPGIYQWECPPGVTEVNVVLMGPGRGGTSSNATASGGEGGALRWRNKIPTVPGAIYTVVVASAGPQAETVSEQRNGSLSSTPSGSLPKSSAFGLEAGNGANGSATNAQLNIGGKNGYSYGSSSTTQMYGGAAAGGSLDSTGLIIETMTYTTDRYRWGVSAGGGGGAIGRSANYYVIGKALDEIWRGGHGAARIIWGTGRAYPATNVADM